MKNGKSPYPGLRPFTEEEAIFFRGREEHVYQIIQSLEEKKFVMITGASGDGKSSIVYAGLVPKAKAGFFKSSFNNWNVCDFRPEKSPFENMCTRISQSLKLDRDYVKKELSYGFSSLIKLYKESDLYFEEGGEAFKKLGAEERVLARRSGANLLIIVDQFEEFFTNSENLIGGNPNNDSHLVANLLNSTIKISKEENLPVYVVFTMRSDYIGNCASLRGIPELIGYSQYFIPRLNREEIAHVIRDPSDLNGDAIQNRLVDHLINSTTEGADQLPIIQHCMNRIWRSAKGEDLDLYHLAVCEGLKSSELPEDQRQKLADLGTRFSDDEKTLNNVINSHANDLFEKSISNFVKKYSDYQRDQIEQCLIFLMKAMAKMDNGKGVRYKCNFGELILNLPTKLNIDQVNELVSLFRKEGNDLLAPYSYQIGQLTAKDSLEISHESLIRNWKALNKWTTADSQDYQTFQDLQAQCDKWEENDRSKNYLLGVGPLDYFETWIKRTEPSVFWILKYQQLAGTDNDVTKSIEDLLIRISVFIAESKSEIDAALVAKRRRRRALLLAGSLALLILTGITIWAFNEKSLADYQKGIAEQQKKAAEIATEEAKLSEEKALYLSAVSDSSLRISEENERLANEAKTEALIQKNLAESSNQYAIEQANIAKAESNKAIIALDQLLEQKNLTETQRDSANLARNEAYELSLKAISTSLALQASRFEVNPQLSGLMVYHAHNFNEEVNGNPDDPSLFSGTTAALKKLKGSNYNLIDDANFSANSLLIDDRKNKIFGINNEGSIDEWTFNDGFFSGVKHTTNTPVETGFGANCADAFILDDNSIAFVDLTGKMTYYNEMNGTVKAQHFSNHNLLINQVIKSENKLISASNDGQIVIQTTDGNKVTTSNIKSAVTAISIENDQICYITKSNKCGLISLLDGTIIKEVNLNSKPRACQIAKDKIVISDNDGGVMILNENLELITQLQFGAVPIELIQISGDGLTLAVASANMRIGIFKLNDLSKDPRIIENIDYRIRSMSFSDKGYLVASLENAECRFWSINTEESIAEICANLKRSFSDIEWKKYIGDKVAYEKACKQ